RAARTAARGDATSAERCGHDGPADREPESESMTRGDQRAVLWIRAHRVVLRNSSLSIVAFLAAFFFTQWWDFTIPSLGRAQYQAVFLANGQTYFGRYYDRI